MTTTTQQRETTNLASVLHAAVEAHAGALCVWEHADGWSAFLRTPGFPVEIELVDGQDAPETVDVADAQVNHPEHFDATATLSDLYGYLETVKHYPDRRIVVYRVH